MENASKAIIMAGSVLIGIIILSLLVVFFNNIRGLRQTESTVTEAEQIAEFNKQYEAYNRNIYGSELLSLAHKVEDYNKREGGDDKAFTKIELNITISSTTAQSLDSKGKFIEAKTYTASELNEKIRELESYISSDAKSKGIGNISVTFQKGKVISTRKIYQLASMRTADINDLGNPQGDYALSYKDLIKEYMEYKILITQIKSKLCKIEGFEYNENTGRIIKMSYKL